MSEEYCHICKERKAIMRCPDPFLDEVWPEDRPYPILDWCEECYQSRVEII